MKYMVITSEGYWGRGSTAVEAARNANVGRSYVSGALYRFPDKAIKGEPACTGWGSCEWTWSDQMMDSLKDDDSFNFPIEMLHEACCLGSGGFNIVKGQLKFTIGEE